MSDLGFGIHTYDTDAITVPEDTIFVTTALHNRLISLYSDNYHEEPYEKYRVFIPKIPHDIMIAKTIPLPTFRVLWEHEDVELLFRTYEDGVAIYANGFATFCFVVEEGGRTDWKYTQSKKWPLNKDFSKDEIKDYSAMFLALWYGIQIALLHPQIKMLFQNPIKEKQYLREGKGKGRKRIVKYIRKHYITAEGIDEALYGKGHRDFKRKTMAWYVIGHWRQYKNGTRKFINGYWKGPLREMKRNLDDGRVRQLAI